MESLSLRKPPASWCGTYIEHRWGSYLSDRRGHGVHGRWNICPLLPFLGVQSYGAIVKSCHDTPVRHEQYERGLVVVCLRILQNSQSDTRTTVLKLHHRQHGSLVILLNYFYFTFQCLLYAFYFVFLLHPIINILQFRESSYFLYYFLAFA